MKYLAVLLLLLSPDLFAQCVQVQDGYLVSSLETLDTCTGYWMSSAHDVRSLSLVDLTASDVAAAFMFGASSVLVFWFAGYGVKLARVLISKI